MSLSVLDNLLRIGQLKAEPRNETEARRMLSMARVRLNDAQLASLSPEGRFISAYNAAHQKRNRAEYEGFLEVEESTIMELCTLVADLIADADKLIAAQSSQ
jgi:hypothetical protein